MIITIDGPAGSGKSTVADILAEKLGFIHFNSGSLYRAVTAHLLKSNVDIKSMRPEDIVQPFKLKVKIIDNKLNVFVDGVNYTPVLRDNKVSEVVAFISQNMSCRTAIDACQKQFCENNDVVIEGRDIGSHVFPNAEVKFFLDCSVRERAQRRFIEEKQKGSSLSFEEILTQIQQRDKMDKTRAYAPLVIPKNAILIDSTNKGIGSVANSMLSHILAKKQLLEIQHG